MMKAKGYIPTILVVDDKPANIKLLFDSLKGTGYRTLAAVDGESAIRQAELARPDLILLDVMMPGLNGFEVCRRLKEESSTRSIPVLFMTAMADTADKLKGFQAGGVDYLTKPLQHEEALARIEAHMNRHRLWADVERYSDILLDMGAAHTLEAAWGELDRLIETSLGLEGLALWLGTAEDFNLRLVSGFSKDSAMDSWPSAGNSPVPPAGDSLVEMAFAEGRQLAAPDEASWSPYPHWARSAGLRAHIITPVLCQGESLGVLGAFFNYPVNFAFDELCRWQRIMAHSLGNAILHARSMNSIRNLSEQLQQENVGLRAEVSTLPSSGNIVGQSAAFLRLLDQIDLVATTDAAVMILGESGTGKELLAQRIHEHSHRHEAPIIRVNCAAIPRELFESEFFGHTTGAFTGAVKDRIGRFELADGGTLFLDEVGEIPLELQGKLLRVLQEGTFERIGEDHTRSTDVRIVAATNRDLSRAIAEGEFREDLFYRLSVFPLTIPPLRERREDIPLLTRHFAMQIARKMGMPPPDITDQDLASYLSYAWPGNIRELQNEIERAMILARGGRLNLRSPASSSAKGAEPTETHVQILTEEQWKSLQCENLRRALKQTAWRVDGPGGAAELLGIRPTTLRSRMKSMGIERPV